MILVVSVKMAISHLLLVIVLLVILIIVNSMINKIKIFVLHANRDIP